MTSAREVSGSDGVPDGDAPLLRIVRGDPAPAELAALVAALVAAVSAYGARGDAPPVADRSEWASRHAALQRPLRVGPGAWVASGREQGARTRAGW